MMNLIDTPKELTITVEPLKKEFEIKQFRKIKLYLRLELEHMTNGILVYRVVLF